MAKQEAVQQAKQAFPATGKGFLLPPVIWAGYFVALYSAQGAACESRLRHAELVGVNTVSLIAILLTAVAVVGLVVVGVWCYRAWRRVEHANEAADPAGASPARFLATGAAMHSALFLVATLWTGLPSFWLDACNGTA